LSDTDKTEVPWAGSKYGSTPLGSSGPPLQLDDGATISSDLSAEKHVSITSSTCFYWLRQLLRVRRSLNTEFAKTLVHAFVTTRVDGNNAVLAGSPRTVTDRLQRILNAAARIVSGTRKFDRGLTHLLHSYVALERQKFPVASSSVLPAAIIVPRYRRSKFGHRAFSVAGPMVWNSLPDHPRDPTLSSDCFKSRMKTHLFPLTSCSRT